MAPTRRKDRWRGGRSRSKGLPTWMAILGILVLFAAVGAAGWFVWRRMQADAFDAATLCPATGATGELAILLDITDPLGATQSLTLRAALERMVADSPRGTLV